MHSGDSIDRFVRFQSGCRCASTSSSTSTHRLTAQQLLQQKWAASAPTIPSSTPRRHRRPTSTMSRRPPGHRLLTKTTMTTTTTTTRRRPGHRPRTTAPKTAGGRTRTRTMHRRRVRHHLLLLPPVSTTGNPSCRIRLFFRRRRICLRALIGRGRRMRRRSRRGLGRTGVDGMGLRRLWGLRWGRIRDWACLRCGGSRCLVVVVVGVWSLLGWFSLRRIRLGEA